MALVAIPDRSGTGYWLDVAADPPTVPVGRDVRLRFTVRERANDAAVTQFEVLHEHPLHLFVVSGDLAYLAHVHPRPLPDGSFDIALQLPRPGAYRLVADVLPAAATPQVLQHTLLTLGHSPSALRPPSEPRAEVLEAIEGGVRARLVAQRARSGDDAHLLVELAEAQSGTPVKDLEPYLGAWGHMFLASYDLADVVHSHPLLEETQPGGPAVTFQTLFARSGWYAVWTQVQRRGRVLTFRFTVRVAPPL